MNRMIPMLVLLSYAGRDEFAAANLWRAWFLARKMLRANAAGDPLLNLMDREETTHDGKRERSY